MLNLALSDDVRWLLDRYILLINAKLRERGQKDESVGSIVGAIVAQFLIENQQEILDDYKLYSEKRLGRALPRLGFRRTEIAAVDPPTTTPISVGRTSTQEEGTVPRDAGRETGAPTSLAERLKSYRSTGSSIARRIAGGNKVLRILAP